MDKFTILMYEDDLEYKDSFEYNLQSKFLVRGCELVIDHRVNGDTIEQDLIVSNPNLIMIDHDLGTLTGEEIIDILDNMPEFTKVLLIYYSGGESLDDLIEKTKKYNCHIQCYTKEGDDLETAILKMVR
ncbi:hypothetical protein PQ459_13910 [Chryseobacterium sp. KACC 21268]|nr:hypothetical protein PQ459_13910 [Chryseobacterium sp. KACC 21268]